jgi:hypothetical protein
MSVLDVAQNSVAAKTNMMPAIPNPGCLCMKASRCVVSGGYLCLTRVVVIWITLQGSQRHRSVT